MTQEYSDIKIIIKPSEQQLQISLDPSTTIIELYDYIKTELKLFDQFEKWTCKTQNGVQLKLDDVIANNINRTLIINTEAQLNLLIWIVNGQKLKLFPSSYNPMTTIEELAQQHLEYFVNEIYQGDSSDIDITISQTPYNDSEIRKKSLQELNINDYSLVVIRWMNKDLKSQQQLISTVFHQSKNYNINESNTNENIQQMDCDPQQSIQLENGQLIKKFPFNEFNYLKDFIQKMIKNMEQKIIENLKSFEKKLIEYVIQLEQHIPEINMLDQNVQQQDCQFITQLKGQYQKYNQTRDTLSQLELYFNQFIENLKKISLNENMITKGVYLSSENQAIIVQMNQDSTITDLFYELKKQCCISVPLEDWICEQQLNKKDKMNINQPISEIESDVLIIQYKNQEVEAK
ncbi:unnamed protein product [Paramecium sonneborni]|uniref:Uncharacterized protein n=1 Tax=Paramecium sonneborni TaxID=65129 RepID=A0A8S1MBE0_9CILI|nr:unnamed protein product [Paramecium sonneborni]